MGEINDARAIEPIARLLNDSNCEVRIYAAAALADLGDPRSLPLLIKALRMGPLIRGCSAEHLGKLGNPRAIEPLINTFTTWPERMHSCAAEALIAITGEDFGCDAKKWQAWWQSQ